MVFILSRDVTLGRSNIVGQPELGPTTRTLVLPPQTLSRCAVLPLPTARNESVGASEFGSLR